MYKDLDNLICSIKLKHEEISHSWQQNKMFVNINYHKKYVRDLMDFNKNPEYLSCIFRYRDFLRDNLLAYIFDIQILGYECRIKNKNSIESKLADYMGILPKSKRKSLDGKMSINKCMNDLFGVRYIFYKRGLLLEDIMQHIEESFRGVKVVLREKDGYRGVHVYFHIDNYVLPWELQIWLRKDASKNKKSHKKHKQYYTNWEYEQKEE